MNSLFWHNGIQKYIWYRDSMRQHSSINFCVVSADLLFLWSMFFFKRAGLSTDHHLVVCILRSLHHPRTRKRFRARREYRIKWELLADKKVGHIFASKVASRLKNSLALLQTLRLSGIYLNQQSLHLQVLVVFENVREVKQVVTKKLLAETKKLKKISVQRKLCLELD